jgi:formiminotetrahydrofolate cyclodeaminase
MPTLADWSLSDLIDHVAAETPSPGGGWSAGVACALAAGLVEMAASFTIDRPAHRGVEERMRGVRAAAAERRREALELAERDLTAYEPVLEAQRLPRDDPGRAERVQAALAAAAEVPGRIAELGADVTELAADAAHRGNPNLHGDALAGALLAEASALAAAHLVDLNLEQHPEDPRRRRAREHALRAWAAREAALR